MYERFDRREAIAKGEFSFLIAFSKQLDKALEHEGVDFIDDALGRLAHAMAHLIREERGVLPNDGGDDDGSEDDDHPSGGVQDPLEDGEADESLPWGGKGRHSPGGTVGGTLRGTRPMTELMPKRAAGRLGNSAKPSKKVKRGKTAKR